MTLRACRGFSLIELAVVLLILSLVVAILLPSLPRLTGSDRTAAMRKLCLAVQENHEEAIFKKKA